MVRRRTPAGLMVLGLVISAAGVRAAGAKDLSVAVPIKVVTAKDVQDVPFCGRAALDSLTIPTAPMLDVSRGTVSIPMEANTPALLDHLQIRLGDGSLHPASTPFCVNGASALKTPLDFLYDGELAGTIVVMPTRSATPLAASSGAYRTSFFAEPLLNPGQVQMIRGPFDGKGAGTRVDVGGMPGYILAETPDALFWTLPPEAPHGSIMITVTAAGRGARFPVYIIGLVMAADHLELLKGQSTKMQATVFGPELVPAAEWTAGDVSATVDLAHVAQQFPGFRIPKPGEPGVIFFRVDNVSQQTVSMKPSKNESFTATLTQASFASGPYTYAGTIQSKKAGGFAINGLVVAFFAPIAGEPLTPDPAASPTD